MKSVSQAWAIASLTLIGACAPLPPTSTPVDGSRPTFTEAICRLPNVTPEVLPTLRCGTVAVPRDHANLASGYFNLAVVVARAPKQPSSPDPVVYISGGPGEPLTIYANYQAQHPYARGRDLILVDQRGTGRSEPELCPAVATKLLEADLALAADITEERLARRRAVYMACRDAAVASGIDLDHFGTTATAEDFDWVRQALGFAQWNVYGESYGTTVAMTLAANHPDSVRSLVLDSVYPPDPIPPRSIIRALALAAFFDTCEHDAACAKSYPHLSEIFAATLDQLRKAPLPLAVPPELRQPDDHVLLTSTLFEFIVGNQIYYPRYYPRLPRLIMAAHDRNVEELGRATAAMALEAAQANPPGSSATNAAVECRDRPHFRMPLAKDASPLDEVHLYGVCADWSDLGPAPLVPVGTPIPTLILAGQFDPVAGPAVSRQVAAAIGAHALLVDFPRLGHNVRFFSSCAAAIVANFIDHPEITPDTTCPSRRPPIPFVVNSERN